MALRQRGQEMAQVGFFQVKVVGFRRFQNGVEEDCGFCAFRGDAEQPAFAADHQWANRIFNLVVAEFHFAVMRTGIPSD